ncbi:MAG: CheB methylesterase domain-containing protein [Paracoccaceae bacterium]|nr:CheB methylesterase domain-containing protein [Paracoccaceae bacterium]
MSKIIVAVENATLRNRLNGAICAAEGMTVAGTAHDLMTTYATVEDHLPNAVVISDTMAALPEFEVMRALFSALDVRWLVVSDPARPVQRPGHLNSRSGLFSMPSDLSPDQIVAQLRSITRHAQRQHSPDRRQTERRRYEGEKVILIGASTGGVEALLTVLSHFPSQCPPTLVVQHTGAGFGQSLVRLLDRQCAPDIVLAGPRNPVTAGKIIVAAGTGAHLTLQNPAAPFAALVDGEAVSGHKPSVDALFHSAVPIARNIVAAVLTGMGRDGAEGLKALCDKGAATFVQDEASSVVYGMPRAAMLAGGAKSSLALDALGPALLEACNETLDRKQSVGR